MPRKICFALAALACGSLFGVMPGWAETRALVVGIDNYKYVNRLRGAENDARDIAATLAGRGVKDIAAFDSGTASRASVLRALDDMVARTRPGDLVIIAFAGHGATERWGKDRPADTEEGEESVAFLMPGFEPTGLGGRPPQYGSFSERILGREMNARLTQVERKGARTVFVADTCHGGGMTRSVSPEVEAAMSFRYQKNYPPPETGDDPVAKEAAKITAGDFDHLKNLSGLTFLAAVDKTKKAPELAIPPASTTMRGALSYAFARAVEGEADTNHDGTLTRSELFYYLRSNVRQISSFIQEPELQPLGADATAVIDLKRDLSVPQATAPQEALPQVTRGRVRILVDGAGGNLPARARTETVDIAAVDKRVEADLVWTPATRQVWTANGDLVAENVASSGIDAIAEREVARRELVSMARTRPLELTLEGSDGVRHAGDVVIARMAVDAACAHQADLCPKPYYVAFNIAGDGTLQYLYPMNGTIHPKFAGKTDALTLDPDFPVLRTRVRPPYGTDTLVFVTAPVPLDHLAAALASMDGHTEPLDMIAALKRSLPQDARLTTQAVFTRP